MWENKVFLSKKKLFHYKSGTMTRIIKQKLMLEFNISKNRSSELIRKKFLITMHKNKN